MKEMYKMVDLIRYFKYGVMLLCVLLLSGTIGASGAYACEGVSVRDAAFNVLRDMHHLYVIGDSREPATQRIHDRLTKRLAYGPDAFNIALRRIAAEDPEVNWSAYGFPSAPPSLPVVALVGTDYNNSRRFFIDYWEPEPDDEDLDVLVHSPVRQTLQEELGRRVAVVLYSPGTDQSAGTYKKVIEAAVDEWSKRNALGVTVVPLDRGDPRERLLVSFIGLPESGPDWAAVMFGRGKLMPPLEGEDISKENIDDCIGILLENCTCVRSPSNLGADIPLLWDSALNLAVKPAVTAEETGTAMGSRLLSSILWTFGILISVVAVATVAIVWRRR